MRKKWNRMALLERLQRIRYEKSQSEAGDELEHMTLAPALLRLARIDHEYEYLLCRAVAQHLLGEVPEPADWDAEEGAVGPAGPNGE